MLKRWIYSAKMRGVKIPNGGWMILDSGGLGGMVRVARTVVVESVRIPRKLFRVFVEVEGMYRNMVEELTIHAVRNTITSFTRLKAQRYHELRKLYPKLPSHYAYTACQDSSTRAL
ncbi:hypothetical protein [Staphylothermus hellenicus]|uniref:hypothetical protein n=1 Tax=Staphylothermus hellenicus TaxID=84599 RepID=UPI0001C4596F|nr:hypothetical protein [Staphylothermus hellenicus]